MNKYTFRFTGKRLGAIGKFELFSEVVRYGRTFEEARLALYTEYEHVTVHLAERDVLKPLRRSKYEAYPTARFWVWHRGSWVKLTLKHRPFCKYCGGWLNQRIFSIRPLPSICISCDAVQTVAFQDRLNHGYSYDNGEGWSSESNTYSYETRKSGSFVLNEWCSSGSDCDGRHRNDGKSACPVDRLQVLPVPEYAFKHATRDYFDGQPILRPDWQRVGRTRVYDQFAQAAGY